MKLNLFELNSLDRGFGIYNHVKDRKVYSFLEYTLCLKNYIGQIFKCTAVLN